jgi:hypothetical protein
MTGPNGHFEEIEGMNSSSESGSDFDTSSSPPTRPPSVTAVGIPVRKGVFLATLFQVELHGEVKIGPLRGLPPVRPRSGQPILIPSMRSTANPEIDSAGALALLDSGLGSAAFATSQHRQSGIATNPLPAAISGSLPLPIQRGTTLLASAKSLPSPRRRFPDRENAILPPPIQGVPGIKPMVVPEDACSIVRLPAPLQRRPGIQTPGMANPVKSLTAIQRHPGSENVAAGSDAHFFTLPLPIQLGPGLELTAAAEHIPPRALPPRPQQGSAATPRVLPSPINRYPGVEGAAGASHPQSGSVPPPAQQPEVPNTAKLPPPIQRRLHLDVPAPAATVTSLPVPMPRFGTTAAATQYASQYPVSQVKKATAKTMTALPPPLQRRLGVQTSATVPLEVANPMFHKGTSGITLPPPIQRNPVINNIAALAPIGSGGILMTASPTGVENMAGESRVRPASHALPPVPQRPTEGAPTTTLPPPIQRRPGATIMAKCHVTAEREPPPVRPRLPNPHKRPVSKPKTSLPPPIQRHRRVEAQPAGPATPPRKIAPLPARAREANKCPKENAAGPALGTPPAPRKCLTAREYDWSLNPTLRPVHFKVKFTFSWSSHIDVLFG